MSSANFATKAVAPKSIGSVAVILVAIVVLLVTIAQPAFSQTFLTLYRFTGGPDGAHPRSGVTVGADGNLYGIAGGYSALGTVFQLTKLGDLTVLHNFMGSPDGENPYGGVAFGPGGNIFSTTSGGGAYGFGTVFEVTTTGTETILYNFRFPGPPSIPNKSWTPHGAVPAASVVFDAQGNLYGTTALGSGYPVGLCQSCGGVFELTPAGTETLLHNFTGAPSDGAAPNDLIIDAQGNLYGTTQGGGASGNGVVFKVTPSGQETILHSFAGSLSDGSSPLSSLLLDAQGNLYGTADEDGAYGGGIVFKLSPDGTETVLYNFGQGSDGKFPSGKLAMDAQGNLYGTTGYGGAYGWGTVFELTPAGTESVLYNFTGGTDGGAATGLMLNDGALYGTTYLGGNMQSCVNRKQQGCGTVFVVSLP